MSKLRAILIFLVTVVLSIAAFFDISTLTDSKAGTIMSIAVPAIILLTGIALYTAEVRALKKNRRIREFVESGQSFNTQSWRERYLKFRTEYRFAEKDPRGMKADLLRNYRTITTYGYFLFFIALTVFALFTLLPDPVEKMSKSGLMMLIAGILCSGDGLRRLSGIPVRLWIKRLGDEYHDVERSYNNGKLIRSGTSGINIGNEYIVIYDPGKVVSFPVSAITDAGRSVEREMQYNTGVYLGTEEKYRVYFIVAQTNGEKRTYNIELNIYESQIVCDEVRLLLNKTDDLNTRYEDTKREDYSIP